MNPSVGNIGQLSSRFRVTEVLRQVIDPELGINIVDMGLIYLVDIDETTKKILIVMTLSTKGCPMGAAISGGVENALEQNFPGYSRTVKLVWEPAWSTDFISKYGREQLEL
jgi:metal-sulfur cluster biosynthetic enzyme